MYSATDTFRVKSVKGSFLQGWAAPKNGPRCVCLMFYADDTLVAAVRADKYDAEAARSGLRYGWCKFEITLTPSHFVLADTLRICCAVSGAELGRISATELTFDTSMPVGLNSPEAITRANLDDRYTDYLPFEPFILRFSEMLGAEEFLSFAYRFVLERRSDTGGVANYKNLVKSEPMKIIRMLVESEEYTNKRNPGLAALFSHEFPLLPIFV